MLCIWQNQQDQWILMCVCMLHSATPSHAIGLCWGGVRGEQCVIGQQAHGVGYSEARRIQPGFCGTMQTGERQTSTAGAAHDVLVGSVGARIASVSL